MTQTPAPTDLTIRLATPSDAEPIANIYNHYVRVGGATFDNEPWPFDQPATLIEKETSGVWLVAHRTGDLDDRLLGWASARLFSARYGYRYSLESAIYIDPSQQTRGVGGLLYRRLHDECRNRGVRHLKARVIADNQASMNFHYRHGYSLVGIQKEVGRMQNRWLDVAILQKLLVPEDSSPADPG